MELGFWNAKCKYYHLRMRNIYTFVFGELGDSDVKFCRCMH